MKTWLFLLIALGVPGVALHAQGCAQCLDNMQSTPPAVQLAYRHAIELLAISGIAVFAGGVFIIRRYR
ncbi:MAG: copper resistance protein CopC [Acidobacteriota bacterium]|nr:copper resistance protein CopC [Acidobacteriota bacterium]